MSVGDALEAARHPLQPGGVILDALRIAGDRGQMTEQGRQIGGQAEDSIDRSRRGHGAIMTGSDLARHEADPRQRLDQLVLLVGEV